MNQGYISIILGPMVLPYNKPNLIIQFSGKSSELMRLIKRFTIAGRNCLVLNYAKDNRYSEEGAISTHDKQCLKAFKVMTLKSIQSQALNYDVIAIDEGQFFGDIAQFCEQMANAGKVVIVAALDGTFERKPFNKILELIPLCEQITKLNAVCWFCKRETAAFTKRIVDSLEVELIGGEESYRPACRNCFTKKYQTPKKIRESENDIKENIPTQKKEKNNIRVTDFIVEQKNVVN